MMLSPGRGPAPQVPGQGAPAWMSPSPDAGKDRKKGGGDRTRCHEIWGLLQPDNPKLHVGRPTRTRLCCCGSSPKLQDGKGKGKDVLDKGLLKGKGA